jgi:hypothetical protein
VVGPEEGADGYQTPVLRGRPFPGSQPSHTHQVRQINPLFVDHWIFLGNHSAKCKGTVPETNNFFFFK